MDLRTHRQAPRFRRLLVRRNRSNTTTDKNGNPRRHGMLEEIAQGWANSGNLYVGTRTPSWLPATMKLPTPALFLTRLTELWPWKKQRRQRHRPARVYEKSIGHHTEFREAAIGNKPTTTPARISNMPAVHKNSAAEQCLPAFPRQEASLGWTETPVQEQPKSQPADYKRISRRLGLQAQQSVGKVPKRQR